MSRLLARLPANTVGSRFFPIARVSAVIVVILLAALSGPIARAARPGSEVNTLDICLVKSLTRADRLLLIRWSFSSMALHPAVQQFVSITGKQRDTINKSMAELVSRLLTTDCREQAAKVMKSDGIALAMRTAFRVFGVLAGRDLLTNVHVQNGKRGLTRYIVTDPKMLALFNAAGPAKHGASATTQAK